MRKLEIMRLHLCSLFALCLSPSLFAVQKLGEVPRVEPSPKAEVGEVLEWTTPEGQEYWYRLPKKSRSKRKPALVLMLHGTGLNHGWSFWNYPIGSGVFQPNDIVVSPDGLTPGNGETFNFVQNKKDEGQIVGLIELFRSNFDVGNVYLYGHSQGAFFCYWFAGGPLAPADPCGRDDPVARQRLDFGRTLGDGHRGGGASAREARPGDGRARGGRSAQPHEEVQG